MHASTHTLISTELLFLPWKSSDLLASLDCVPQGKHIGWRNTFSLPVSYDVEMISGLLDLENDSLAVKHIPTDLLKRRFVVCGA